MRKKGFVASALLDFYAILLFGLIITVFYILFTLAVKTGGGAQADFEKISQEEMDFSYSVLSFLRTPVEYGGDMVTVAELLTLQEARDKNKDEFKLLEKAFKDAFDHSTKGVQIKVDNVFFGLITDSCVGAPFPSYTTTLPTQDNQKIVTVSFFRCVDQTSGMPISERGAAIL